MRLMERILVKDTTKKIGKKVLLKGWINNLRDHGKISFIDLRDRSGIIQVFATSELSNQVHTQSAVEIEGEIKNRPEKLINPNLETGKIEVEASKLTVISKSRELPIDMGKEELELELPTLLDLRPLTLKNPKQTQIFKIQAEIAKNFRDAAEALDCTEIFVPTISASATEGGAEVFNIKYYDKEAFLTQSPQLYKQIMVGVFERVYTISHAYRAEPSITTRHLSEVVQLDCEIGFIDGFEELLNALEFVGKSLVKVGVKEKPLVSTKIPRLKLREAQKIIEERTGRNLTKEMDLNPEDEIEICAWAQEVHKSDFVTITHFPTKKRAFYTMPDPEEPEYSLSYDLLFRGIEISSGSQRINDYDTLVKAIKERSLNPKDFEMYLTAFEYGMPLEGGFSFGLERLTMKLLNLQNVREASLFPRDMKRVDKLL